jgi:hypothetical protein
MTPTPRPDGGRRALQIVLGTLSAIPFATGLAGVLVGPGALPGNNTPVTANVDSAYRYGHGLWFTAAPILWSSLPGIERQTTLLRVVGAAIFVGGLGRVAAWRSTGRPDPVLIGATALELVGVPALMAWQHRVATLAGTA